MIRMIKNMEDNNIKPSIISSFYSMINDLKKAGFSRRDVGLLLRDRTKPKMGLREIENVLNAISQFEKDFIKFKLIIEGK